MGTIRIATFNCENIFARPKVHDAGPAESRKIFEKAGELQEALLQPVFDHARIAELKKDLKGYVTVHDLRGDHTKAKGVGSWDGWVKFETNKVGTVATQNTARVIADTQADVICLMEIESRPSLQRFHDDVLVKTVLKGDTAKGYPYVLLIDGNDPRGIDVAVMSKLPVTWISSHIHETTENGKTPLFSRDCLEVQVELPNGRPLLFLINHLKSMYMCPKDDPKCDKRRLPQARRVAEIVAGHRIDDEFLVVAGDLNSPPESPSLAPLVAKSGLYNTIEEEEPKNRWTYAGGKKQQLDYLLVSPALRDNLTGSGIFRKGMWIGKTFDHYATVTDEKMTPASDHAAVIAEFEF